jgi:hypothetical protein
MLATLDSNNVEDFKQRYQGCFGWLSYEGNETLVVLTNVSRDRVTFNTAKGKDFFAFVNSGVQFKFAPIMRGWYTTSVGPVLLQRVAARQYQRGISSANTSCFCLGYGSSEQLRPRALTVGILEEVFETQTPKFTDQGPCVLSRFFCVG